MLQLPDNIRSVLVTLLPASIVNEVACFVFYDDHPRDNKNIDITLCTKHGEVKEYFQRELKSSLMLDSQHIPREIRILRNKRNELYYFVLAGDELTLLSSKEEIKIIHRITNVERYDYTDIACTGQPSLRITCREDAVPIIFDEDLQNYKSDLNISFSKNSNDELLPVITHLMQKLTEAKYNVKCAEKSYTDMINLHQTVGFVMYRRYYPHLDESLIKENSKDLALLLKIKSQSPWIKICNKKVVIVYSLCNKNKEPLDNIHILLHGAPALSTEYTTKIFEETPNSPFWSETNKQTIKPNINTSVAIVLTLEELKENLFSRIEFNGVLFYKQDGQEFLLPIEDVSLSAKDTMGNDFDVLASDLTDKNTLLAILATTEKTELILRHIKSHTNEELSCNIFCEYLKMEIVPYADNVFVHRKSPYHVLNGTMVIWHGRERTNHSYAISVHSRTPSQVLALVHYIHDTIPYRIVVTTPNYKLTAKISDLTKYNEDLLIETQVIPDYNNYATSMLNRTNLVLEYLDNSMIKMSESKNPTIQSKIGSEIDLFADDVIYKEFKNKMRLEASKGVDALNEAVLVKKADSEDIMFID